jgi:hypothetical protein
MKGSKFFYLITAAVVIAVVAWLIQRSEQASWQEEPLASGADLFGDLPVNDVAAVKISSPDGRVTLLRSEEGWVVEERADYPSNFEKISDLIRRLGNLKAVQSVPVAESDRGSLALQAGDENLPREEAGTLIELSDASGGALAVLTVGKMHVTTPAGTRPEMGGNTTGRYVLTARQPGTAYVVAETFTDLQASPAMWIDTGFVRPGMARLIEVRGAGKDRAWTIRRDAPGAAWQLVGLRKNQSADATKLMSIDSMLTGLTVADVPDGPDDARIKPLAEKPTTMVAETFDGVRYTFTIGEGGGDSLPVRVSAEALELEETPAEGQVPEQAAAAMEEKRKAQQEKLEVAAKYQDRVVFVPRNFVQPFLEARSALIGGAAAR